RPAAAATAILSWSCWPSTCAVPRKFQPPAACAEGARTHSMVTAKRETSTLFMQKSPPQLCGNRHMMGPSGVQGQVKWCDSLLLKTHPLCGSFLKSRAGRYPLISKQMPAARILAPDLASIKGMNGLKTAFLLTAMTLLIVFVGDWVGGRNGMVYALVIAGVMNFVSYFFSDKIALTMYRAQAVTREQLPRVYQIVERLAQKMSIPMPKIFVIPTDSPNAFATGRNPHHASVA